MTNSRPSRRQLQAFQTALQDAAEAQNRFTRTLAHFNDLAARRDAYLASLR